MNEVIGTQLNFLEDAKAYTDEQVAIVDEKLTLEMQTLKTQLQNEMKQLLDTVNATSEELQRRMSLLEQNVNASIEDNKRWVNQQIADLTIYINKQVNNLLTLITEGDNMVKDYVDQEIQKVIEMIPTLSNPKVIDPIDGKLKNLQEVLNNLYEAFKISAWTAGEFDRYGITAREFDDILLTAYDFDIQGMRLQEKDERFYMRSPVTGKIAFYKDIINWLIAQHQLAPIAQVFDDYGITASGYDALNLSAFDHDFTYFLPKEVII